MTQAISEQSGAATLLGSFEIVRRLARGGMAEIFLARTRGPSGAGKLVVLKQILPAYAQKPRFVQLFLDEARLAASLDHPHIARVYDVGRVDGSYFFTMEYLHGQDVRSILHRAWQSWRTGPTGARFPIEHAVQIARHVASALHYAHGKQRSDGKLLGIVHRDVSPSNIIVTYDGATTLLDFGVAKTTASTVKTRTGALKGKIAYMSPEQARGAAVDRRSDLFSLGIVLWEMVATQRLYRADNDLATLQLIIHQPPPPPSQVRPDCPPELDRIVLRALAQDPDARYQTAEQLVVELDELAREHELAQSSTALAATLAELFGGDDAGDLTTPVSASDFLEVSASPDDDDDDDLDDADDEQTVHAAPMPELLATEAQAADPVTLAAPPIAVPRASHPTPPVPLAVVRAPRPAPDVPLAVVPGNAPATPATPGTPVAPFQAVPPWQSGRPAGPGPSDWIARRIARSWPLVDLPALDPAAFERQRQIVLRVAAGLVAGVVLIALLVGSC